MKGPFEVDVDAIMALPEAEQKQALAELAVFKRKLEENPLWGYMPHLGELGEKLEKGEPITGEESRGQVEFHEANQRDVHMAAAVAGNRFGKSHAGAVDNLIQLLPPQFVPPWLEVYRRRPYHGGDFKCRTVVVDLPNGLVKTWLPKLRKLVPPAALKGGSFERAWKDKDRILYFADGAWWDFLTHDMDVDSFASTDLDRVHWDEEPPGEMGKLQFEESEVRLTDRDGDCRITMTPLLGLTWMYHELTINDVPRQDDEVWVVRGSQSHNPHLSEKGKQRNRRRWAKKGAEVAEAREHGRFTHVEGLIYPEFVDEAPPVGHVIADRDLPRESEGSKPTVPVYAAIDPGINHPAGLVFFFIDPEDVAEVFFAEKWSDCIVADIAEKYHTVCQTLAFRPRWTIIDPSARNRNPQTGRSVQQEFSEHGVHTIPGQNSVIAGLDRTKERLRTQRLVIHRDACNQLIDEFKHYRWKRAKGQIEQAPKQEPIKVNDDLLDPLRYGLMSMPQKAKIREPEENLSAANRAFRKSLERAGRRNRRVRVGS